MDHAKTLRVAAERLRKGIKGTPSCGDALDEAADEIDRLRGALADIINPIGAMQRDLEDGYQLDGAMAVAMANDPEHYKRIARAALTPNAGIERLQSSPLE